MAATESQRIDVINKARNRTLAADDPGWHAVQDGAERQVPADVAAYNEAINLGGPVPGASVHKAI